MYKLSPSDFAFLYKECKYCFYLKVKHDTPRPFSPFPAVFSAISSQIQGMLVGKNLQTLSKKLPDLKIIDQEKFVKSKIIENTSLFISGRYDLLAKNKDNTYTIVDLKISKPGEDKVDTYKTQLNSYKYTLENPKEGKPYKITRLGLLIFYPDSASFKDHKADLSFPPKWMEVPIDDKEFLKMMKNIDKMISNPKPPERDPTCKFCAYCYLRLSGDTE